MDLKILKIAANTENNKEIKNYTHKAKYKNSMCGDEMEVSLIVKNKNIKDFGYKCKSCIYCQASVSLLSKNSINLSLEKVKNLINCAIYYFEENSSGFPKEWKIFNQIFNKKNISRKECILLPFKTISKALNLSK